MSDRWIVDLTVEPSDKTTEFDQVLHHRESVRKESKVLQKVDAHLDEEGLAYRKPDSCARLKSYKYYRFSHVRPFSGSK